MFIFQNTIHDINNIDFCGGDSENAIYQKQFTTLEETVDYITSTHIQPCKNKNENENDFCLYNINDENEYTLSDKSIKTWDDVIDRLKNGVIITQHLSEDTPIYSYQIIDTDHQRMIKKFVLNNSCGANHFETQTFFDSKDKAVSTIIDDMLNIDKSADYVKQHIEINDNIYVDLFSNHFYIHSMYSDTTTLDYDQFNKLFSPDDVKGDVEPTNIDQLRQWFFDGKGCTLFWSDRASCHIQINEVLVPEV